MFAPPKNLFCLIERFINKRPERLNMDHYHTLPNGEEALTRDQIMHPDCQHDLSGWIVACTPGAAGAEHGTLDVDDLAMSILEAGGYPPIPWALFFGEKADALKVIYGRAAEERAIG